MLEIVRDIGDMARFRDSRVGEPAPLVALGRGMIEFEDPQILGPPNPIGEGVEARAEYEDLPHAVSHRAVSHILGEAAAHGDEEPQRPPLGPLFGQRDRLVGVSPEDHERQRVGEDDPALENLMGRPMPGRANRGAARLSVLHCARVEARSGSVEETKLDAENVPPL